MSRLWCPAEVTKDIRLPLPAGASPRYVPPKKRCTIFSHALALKKNRTTVSVLVLFAVLLSTLQLTQTLEEGPV